MVLAVAPGAHRRLHRPGGVVRIAVFGLGEQGIVGALVCQNVEVVSKNRMSAWRFNRVATEKNTASCSSASAARKKSIAR